MFHLKKYFLLLAITVLPLTAHAQTPSFRMPIDCTLGENCWIINYFDADPSKNAADFRCGHLTYDGHHGTDFGLADLTAMRAGVDVLAAADGTVLRIRDETEDKIVTEEERLQLLEEDRGCGNGAIINHGAAWETIYCHMKKGSVTVKPGQNVKAGQKLGEVGASGIAQFPHVHLGVFFEGKKIDPFTGAGTQDGCGKTGAGLWDPKLGLQYEPVSIYAAGFKAGVPDFNEIKADSRSAETIAVDSEALTFWIAMYGAAKDDRIDITILDPQGNVFEKQEIIQPKDRATQFHYVGKRTTNTKLMPGTYTGSVTVTRTMADGRTITRERQEKLSVR